MDRAKCKARAGHYLGHDFNTCPIRSIMDDVHLQVALQLHGSAHMAPIHGWPDDYTAWVCTLWPQVKRSLEDRSVQQVGG